jgi:hypothetical protein
VHDPRVPAPSRAFLARLLALAAAGALSVIALALAAGLALAGERPGWWNPRLLDDPAAASLAARSAQNLVVNALHRPRAQDPPGQPWTVSLPAGQASAWLTLELPRWLANQRADIPWPDHLADIQVDFAPGSVRLGALVRRGSAEHVVHARLVPSLAPDGSLRMTARDAGIGRLPLPTHWALRRVAHDASPEVRSLLAALAGERPLAASPALRLEDGRVVRILAVEPRAGVLDVTCVTQTP